MAIDNSDRVLYLRSELKVGFWNGLTAPTAYFGPMNFTKIELTPPKQKTGRLMSNMENSFGNLRDSQLGVTDPATINCEFDSMPGEMLALLLGADTADLSQTTSAVADEAITPVLGAWKNLANQYLSPHGTGTEIVFETTGTPDVTVPLINFELDLVNGMYRAITVAGVAATKVSYHTATRTGEIYHAGLAKNRFVQFKGTATEMVTRKRCSLQIYKANLMPSGKFDPVADQYLKGNLDGDLLVPAGLDSPWKAVFLDMAA